MASRREVPSTVVEVGRFKLSVATHAGPRVLAFSRADGPNLFAALPGDQLTGGGNTYDLLGGHRLWIAPENPTVTYRSDTHLVDISVDGSGIVVSGSVDSQGIRKTIRVTDEGETIRVSHTVENGSNGPVTLAPWAITQLAPGGEALLPQTREPVDPHGLLPNRTVVLWPYTTLGEPEVRFTDGLIAVTASARDEPTKIGITNRHGWMAYALDGEVFVKWARPLPDSADTVDFNATMQCFRNERFLELETLGALETVEAGGAVTHDEWWTVVARGNGSAIEAIDGLETPAGMMHP